MAALPAGIPAHRRSRSGDPYTSALSAALALGSSQLSVYYVAMVMKTEQRLIDEELRNECARLGYVRTGDTIEHGRLALEEAGLIHPTGVTRLTSTGAPAREWVADPLLLSMDLDIRQKAPPQDARVRNPGKEAIRGFLAELVELVDASGLEPSPTFLRVLRWLCSKYWSEE